MLDGGQAVTTCGEETRAPGTVPGPGPLEILMRGYGDILAEGSSPKLWKTPHLPRQNPWDGSQ